MKVIIIVIVVLLVFAGIGLLAKNKASRLADQKNLVESLDAEVKKLFKAKKSRQARWQVIS